MSNEQEQNLGDQLPDESGPFGGWDKIPKRVQKRLRPFFYDGKGNLIAPQELIESMPEVFNREFPRGRKRLEPQQIAQSLCEHAVQKTSAGNEKLAKQMKDLANIVYPRTNIPS